MNKQKIKYLIIALSIISFSKINSQTCGFGCLGLSGVFGGYSLQKYEADGLNQYLNNLAFPGSSNTNTESQFKFNEGRGFKVGINLVRANYSNFFFTFKGYYQFLYETQEVEKELGMPNTLPTSYNVKFEMNNWGIGLDLGIPLFGFVDWKIAEGELKFFSPKLTLDYANPNANSKLNGETFTPDKVNMGFSIGSGLIFNVFEDYVSIEATGMFTFVEIDYLTSDIDGAKIPDENSNTKFISKGGLQGIIQLNVGIPF